MCLQAAMLKFCVYLNVGEASGAEKFGISVQSTVQSIYVFDGE